MGGWKAEELPEPSLCPHSTPNYKKVKGMLDCALGFSQLPSPPLPSLGTRPLTLEGHGLHREHKGVVVAMQALLPDHRHDGAGCQDFHHGLLATAAIDPGRTEKGGQGERGPGRWARLLCVHRQVADPLWPRRLTGGPVSIRPAHVS